MITRAPWMDRRVARGIAAPLTMGHLITGDWKADQRHGNGFCKFSDGTKFRGRWEGDGWMQSSADPARCKVIATAGLSRAVAGQQASFEIKVANRKRGFYEPRVSNHRKSNAIAHTDYINHTRWPLFIYHFL